MGGYRLLYVAKSKNGKNVFLCQYIHSFVFPEMAGSTPINPPLTFVGKTYRVHQNPWNFSVIRIYGTLYF